jgi:hypothetical protein
VRRTDDKRAANGRRTDGNPLADAPLSAAVSREPARHPAFIVGIRMTEYGASPADVAPVFPGFPRFSF